MDNPVAVDVNRLFLNLHTPLDGLIGFLVLKKLY